jgi:NB-ARC domain
MQTTLRGGTVHGFDPFERMKARLQRAREDSDSSYFSCLMYAGEFALKILTLELIAGLETDSAQRPYEFEYRLVRADGLGEWQKVIDELCIGPAASQLIDQARSMQVAYTQAHGPEATSWQRICIDGVEEARGVVDHDFQSSKRLRASLRRWADSFVWLRNKVRAHGAPTPTDQLRMAGPLGLSVNLLLENADPTTRSWAYLLQNQKLKYRVSSFGGDRESFSYLTRETEHQHIEGCYIYLDRPRRINLLTSDPELRDFFVPNGGFRASSFEMLSYISGDTANGDSAPYQVPVRARPPSETKSGIQLDVVNEVYANIPPRREDYVSRPLLEDELTRVLTDDRNPMVTLQGRGGVGKTSLALEVLHKLTNTQDYFAIVWLSARDIDLLPEGPRLVHPDVLTVDEIAKTFSSLMGVASESQAYLANCLSGQVADGPFIVVLDNFETVSDPQGTYAFLNNSVRIPNKVLITTRTRDFKSDYPIEVRGLARPEFDQLVRETAARLSLPDLKSEYLEDLFERADGHPYITKVVLGEVSRRGHSVDLPTYVKTNDALLDALFDRTYIALSVAAQRVYLTLASWQTRIPVLGLAAVLLSGSNERIDVERAIDELDRSSLIQLDIADTDGSSFVSVPLAAAIFGRRRLATSVWKVLVDEDLRALRLLGTTTAKEMRLGLARSVESLARGARRQMSASEGSTTELDVLRFIAEDYPPAWLSLAGIQEDWGYFADATLSVNRYLEVRPTDISGWLQLTRLLRRQEEIWPELNALVQTASHASLPLGDMSEIAYRANYLMSEHAEDIGGDERRAAARSLRRSFERYLDVASATDLSRLAWLAVYDQDPTAARELALEGLRRDPSNDYCRNLVENLRGK